ncbi:hypothetical protein FZC33_01065 [Labrys sp. KNU-23]|uniref:hypothetical protein n=1 Tax=Labrys sp. KNU-23 TaxID=2789216 RepID=UPI0011EF297A|nr:hypothetical protein [Labrys sp. KNU-23]QEN84901.1 hypothetical protein FZC33_01065 [Labrys sp. KNU-23]
MTHRQGHIRPSVILLGIFSALAAGMFLITAFQLRGLYLMQLMNRPAMAMEMSQTPSPIESGKAHIPS